MIKVCRARKRSADPLLLHIAAAASSTQGVGTPSHGPLEWLRIRAGSTLKPSTGVTPLHPPTTQVYDACLRALAGHQLHDVRAPALQRAASFLKIERLVIDTGDAAFMPAGMTEHALDHMRRDAEMIVQGGR